MMVIEKDMEVEGSHILARQKTKESEKILDYDYKNVPDAPFALPSVPKRPCKRG